VEQQELKPESILKGFSKEKQKQNAIQILDVLRQPHDTVRIRGKRIELLKSNGELKDVVDLDTFLNHATRKSVPTQEMNASMRNREREVVKAAKIDHLVPNVQLNASLKQTRPAGSSNDKSKNSKKERRSHYWSVWNGRP
jgi:hypothetical protein